MSSSGSSGAPSDTELPSSVTKSLLSRQARPVHQDEQGELQPLTTAASSSHEDEHESPAVHAKSSRINLVCCALLALLVPGLLGSALTLIALPSCLKGKDNRSTSGTAAALPCVPISTGRQAPDPPVTIPTTTTHSPITPSSATPSTTPSSTIVARGSLASAVLVDPPVKVFTRGKLFYRSAYVDDSRGHLFVGAMEKLFQLPLDDISSPNSKELDLMAPSDNVNKCGVYRGQHRLGKDVDCRNHIRVVQPIRDGSTLYICGTNARAPTDWQVQAADLTLVPAANQVPVLGVNTSNEAQGRCPNYLHQSSRTLWLDDAPTSGSSCVVALTVLSTDQYGFFRLTPRGFPLRSTDTRAIQKPHVVDAFSTAEHAYFVFREEGIERKACGARNVSTLARLCKNEVGVSTRSADPWTTLMKTRLQCVDITAANFIFNELYASQWVPDLENGVLFGAFVTVTRSWGRAEHHDSAVCAFRLRDVERVLGNSTFYNLVQSDDYTLSQPLHISKVPSPRPGMICPPGPRNLSTVDTQFWLEHPLVTQTPKQRHDRPFYAHSGVAFRTLVAFTLNETWGAWVVCYVATENGTILKLAEESVATGGVPAPARLVDTFKATAEPIRKMLVSMQFLR
ncbi:semaphorin-2A-like [Dermacentor variabilis]|uniref:semaphorin-2A-like n=1 Tax=Dermacentor variabilis TaxID=34621 RepID=UPI003F5C1C98